ncbi:MAG TPA: hypothetical protein VK464_13355 [Symbiobacteriaceae bacterium]|jgi:hypothetical protein|nr:hypothetical protein [Symbiobacteriaceae bacterium]
MANETGSQPVARTSTPVKIKKTQRRKGPAPKSPTAVAEKSGLTLLSTTASNNVADMARADGLARDEFVVVLRADTVNGAVGIYPAPAGTPNSVMIRWTKQNRQISVHFADVYDEHPDLRPEMQVDCKVSVGPDLELGRDCVWVTTFGALPHVVKHRKKTEASAKSAKAESTEAEEQAE